MCDVCVDYIEDNIKEAYIVILLPCILFKYTVCVIIQQNNTYIVNLEEGREEKPETAMRRRSKGMRRMKWKF